MLTPTVQGAGVTPRWDIALDSTQLNRRALSVRLSGSLRFQFERDFSIRLGSQHTRRGVGGTFQYGQSHHFDARARHGQFLLTLLS